ncbi:helitron_like_N domain-containing protein [Trichonephila clavipes]|nr:helitron_like_N domain-containing protein [Trichonephila clavipes]
MYSIEWQKRGLPHAHILVWLINKITPDQIDQIISAEIPGKDIDPNLSDVVTKNMIHRPCDAFNNNSSCISDGKCTKRYPRKLVSDTITDKDGYPLYHRRSVEDGSKSVVLKKYETLILKQIIVGLSHIHHCFQRPSKHTLMLSIAIQ